MDTLKRKFKISNYSFNGWAFVVTALILIIVFNIYPVINSLWLSLHTGKGVVYQFNGLGNIKRLFSDTVFLKALTNTFTYFIIQVPIMILLALTFATLLNDPKLRFKSLFRTAIFLPCVTSLVAYSILFKSMFSYDGIINQFLLTLHIINDPIKWLMDPFGLKLLLFLL